MNDVGDSQPAARAERDVGFVGLGAMGRPMSAHLLADGWTVWGHDLDPAALANHETTGGRTVTDVSHLAARVDVVVTSLPSYGALVEVLRALGRFPRHGKPLVVIETSTLALPDKLAARDLAHEHGIELLDCPVSGTSAQAQQGDLVAYLSGGGPETQAAAVRVVSSMTRAAHLVGEFGNGTKMKLVANLLVAVHNLAAAEALTLAKRAGLNLPQVLTAVADGAGGSRMLEVRGPLMVAEAFDQATARVEIFQKDLSAIQALAVEVSSPTPLLTTSAVYYDAAMAQGRSQQDTACVFAVLQSLDRTEGARELRKRPLS